MYLFRSCGLVTRQRCRSLRASVGNSQHPRALPARSLWSAGGRDCVSVTQSPHPGGFRGGEAHLPTRRERGVWKTTVKEVASEAILASWVQFDRYQVKGGQSHWGRDTENVWSGEGPASSWTPVEGVAEEVVADSSAKKDGTKW